MRDERPPGFDSAWQMCPATKKYVRKAMPPDDFKDAMETYPPAIAALDHKRTSRHGSMRFRRKGCAQAAMEFLRPARFGGKRPESLRGAHG
jgi:hypothetical protein